MAHDVNQGETDFAAQVRSALVSKISAERFELWIPKSTEWHFHDGQLRLKFAHEFTCHLARQNLSEDLKLALQEAGCADGKVTFEWEPVSHLQPATSSNSRQQSKTAPASSHEKLESPRVVSLAYRNREQVSRSEKNYAAAQPASSAKLRSLVASRSLTSTSSSVSASHSTRSALANQAQLDPGDSVSKSTTGLEHWQQFIHGDCNRLAWGTARMVVDAPGEMTPVFLHGPSGVGKSLLATGIAERLRVVKRMRRVVHMSSEQFLNDFTEGLRGGGLPMFRRKYRDVEALILEDIQFFVGKKSSTGEVRQTLDNLLRLGKQVLFTADRSLNDLQHLGSDLVGRLRGGLTVPIFPLDEETRFQILRRDLQVARVEIDPSVLREIAGRVTGDGRVLSGIAKRLTAIASLQAHPLDWDGCWSAISDLVQATRPVVRIIDIDRVVCDVFGLEPESLKSQSKIRRVSQPRMLAMFLARKYTPAAYKEIGYYFGRRRHSTVISAEKTVSEWLRENSDLDVRPGLKIRDAIRHVESQLQVG
ncbi:MAG: DnaA/Hda family protein [bacterium]|nr:DnaA/Hda family protein [bacterium]